MAEFEREEIAIVGLAGRFPGAGTIRELWANLCAGQEGIRDLAPEELTAAGVDPATSASPDYVTRGGPLDDADKFDAAFFGYGRREAELMDPQHRVFLECSWSALEDAGYDSERFSGRIGIFGGVAPNTYRQKILETRPELMEMAGHFGLIISGEREHAITRSAFKLGLEGPAVSVSAASSTSGVALHLACQSVLSGETDMALAGGATVLVPLTDGYVYQEDGILSPDGRCRTFDANARGTVVSSGVGMVVIKRLSDAIQDGDTVRAVIKGTAINNDGSDKIGYSAPSVSGQQSVIREALAMADVGADTIGYVEAHGTGTFIGDPIEVEALTRAYRRDTDKTGYCAIGSIKSSIGHLSAAAAIAGVIKATLAVETGIIPPSLNFDEPNPQIDFAASPFFVANELTPWPTGHPVRRAAVSSFGLGGTNAHIIVEEPPATVTAAPAERRPELFVLSAATPEALDQAATDLADHLRDHDELEPADVAHTLAVGRRPLAYRRGVVADDLDGVANALSDEAKRSAVAQAAERATLFMFPGGGAQHVGMGRRLYQRMPEYRRAFDRCADLVGDRLGEDLRTLVFEDANHDLERPTWGLATLFAAEYSTARLLDSFGIKPDLMIGHSIGEYTAACVAGVLSLEDALDLVLVRGELFESLPPGAMLSVPMTPTELESRLSADLSIAVVNRPDMCIVAGEVDGIDALEAALKNEGVDSRRLRIGVAAHSHLVEPILDQFRAAASRIDFNRPEIPIVSNLTGSVVDPEAVTDPEYWVQHLRNT
ncbi:MAG: type I polyketide synthase, partial [Acidimicrobiia bacterium]